MSQSLCIKEIYMNPELRFFAVECLAPHSPTFAVFERRLRQQKQLQL